MGVYEIILKTEKGFNFQVPSMSNPPGILFDPFSVIPLFSDFVTTDSLAMINTPQTLYIYGDLHLCIKYALLLEVRI